LYPAQVTLAVIGKNLLQAAETCSALLRLQFGVGCFGRVARERAWIVAAAHSALTEVLTAPTEVLNILCLPLHWSIPCTAVQGKTQTAFKA